MAGGQASDAVGDLAGEALADAEVVSWSTVGANGTVLAFLAGRHNRAGETLIVVHIALF